MAKSAHVRPTVPSVTFVGPQSDEIPAPLQQGHQQQSGEEQAERGGSVQRRHSPLMIWRGVDRERCASTTTLPTPAPGAFVQGPLLSAPPLSARRAVQSPTRRPAVVQHRSLSPKRKESAPTLPSGPSPPVMTLQASIPVHEAPGYTTTRQPPSSPMVTPRSPVLLPRSPVVAPRSPAVAPRSPMLSHRSTICVSTAANAATAKPHPGTHSPSTPRSRRHPQRLLSAPSPPCKPQEQQPAMATSSSARGPEACATASTALQDVPSPQRQGNSAKLMAHVELPSRSPPARQQSLAEIVASAPMPHQQDVLLSSGSPQRRKCTAEALATRPQPPQLHDSTRGPIRQTSVPDGAAAAAVAAAAAAVATVATSVQALPVNSRATLTRLPSDMAAEATPVSSVQRLTDLASAEPLATATSASVPRIVADFSSATTATARLLRSEASSTRPGGVLLASTATVSSSADCPLLPPPPGLSHLLGAADRWPLGLLSNPAAGMHQGIGGTSSSSASRPPASQSLDGWGQASAFALPRMPSAPQSGSRGNGLSAVVTANTAPAASPREKLCSSTASLLHREACGDAAAALLQEGCSSAADARPVPEGRGEWQLGGGREANAGPDRRRFLV